MNDSVIETNGGGSGVSPNNDGPLFSLQKVYVKDFSFEVPGAPAVFAENLEALKFQLNLKNSQTALEEDRYEIVLHVNVQATLEDRTVFLIELDQAGIFFITGYAEDEFRKLAGSYCPTTLFPYAREVISSTVSRGGFPPLVLQPINFDAVYAQAAEQMARA
jgi:preprotein translocase subunit SecB